MRLLYFSLLLLLCTTGASARETIRMGKAGRTESSAHGLQPLHSELQISGPVKIAPAIRVFVKKTPVRADASSIPAEYHDAVNCLLSTRLITAHEKNYLSHIYPSLHFW